jgi:hypothetical protein
VNVEIPCVCPSLSTGAPRHQVDTVTLHDKLGFRAALTVRNTIIVIKNQDAVASIAEILAALTEVYLLEGIESWSIVDQRNKPVEVNRETVRAFLDDHPEEAMTVGNAADDIYQEQVLGPLVRQASKRSRPTPTESSTSVTTGSGPKRPKRSKPSSISTTPMDDTATTYAWRAGDSN